MKEGLLTEGDTQKWKKEFDVNVLALCIATREAIGVMRTNDIQGHVIHINSTAGHAAPKAPKLNVYSATKYAVTALTETLRQELNTLQSKIKVTVT
jgi:NADP+-dependent farnesol dehydrogenase